MDGRSGIHSTIIVWLFATVTVVINVPYPRYVVSGVFALDCKSNFLKGP